MWDGSFMKIGTIIATKNRYQRVKLKDGKDNKKALNNKALNNKALLTRNKHKINKTRSLSTNNLGASCEI